MIDKITSGKGYLVDLENRVKADLLDNVYKSLPVSLLAVIIVSLVLAWFSIKVAPFDHILLWLGLVLIVTTIRWITLRYYLTSRDSPSYNHALWSRISIAGALLSGISWGAASILIFPEHSIPHQAFMTLLIAGMTAGAVTTLSAQPGALFAYILLSTLPLAIRFTLAEHEMALGMAAMVVVFTLMLVPISLRFHHRLRQELTEHYERELAEDRLEESEELFKNIFQNAPMGIGAASLEGKLQNANQLFCGMLGYSLDELVSMKFSDFTHPDDLADSRLRFMELLQGKVQAYQVQKRYIRKDGKTIWARTYVRGIYDQEGKLQYIVGMIEDITEQVRSEKEMRELVDHLKVMYDATPDMLFLHDSAGRIVYANEKACSTLGLSLGEIVRVSPDSISGAGYHFETALQRINRTLAGEPQEFEWVMRNDEGREFPVEVRLAPLPHIDQQTGGQLLAIVRDISEKKQTEAALRESEELIRYRANYDELTNLPNRYNFLQQLESALALNDRRKNMVGLLYLDLDRFKNVNDTLGHHIGDALLTEVASRLQKTLRVTDTVARLGGDEFTILLQDMDDDIRPLIIAESIISELDKPFHIDGHEIYTGTSIGITLAPNDGDDAHTLLKNADMAMYKAKEQGRNTFQYFTKELTEKAEHYVAIEKDLRRAMHQGEFIIYYQPVINLEDERITGVEALVRWKHPERGIVSPAEFIPVAEETNLIIELGEWVLRNACAEVARWNISDLHLAINVSSNQLKGGFDGQVVGDILKQTQFPAERLVFEITESLLMEEREDIIQALNAFRDLSIHLSVDDFGTGYSSLSYLRRFPVNILKIDRSFVRDMETDLGDAQLVETIIGMANNLKLRVVAEGVESEAQARLLRAQGCDMVQGFYYGRPQPGKELIKLFQKLKPPVYPASIRPEERRS